MHDLKCQAVDCLYNEAKCCTSDAIKIENDTCCRTYTKDAEKKAKGCGCN